MSSSRAQQPPPDYSGAAELAESFTRFADKLVARQNDTIAQVAGTLLTYDNMVKSLAATVTAQAEAMKAQGLEIATLQQADLERTKFIAEIELKREEMARVSAETPRLSQRFARSADPSCIRSSRRECSRRLLPPRLPRRPQWTAEGA